MTWNYTGQTALVTGASSGIGKAFAEQLARTGCHLILVARSRDRLEQLAYELKTSYGVEVHVITADLADPTSVDHLAKELTDRQLTIDILVNNAGFGTMGAFHQLSPERLMQEIQLNVASLTALTHLCLGPMLVSSRGVVINVASMTAFQPAPYMAVYGATKAYVLSFTEALWAEYQSRGVRIVALCPGETKSSFHTVSGTDELTSKRMEPEDVVHAAFQAVDRNKSNKIVGVRNYIMAQLPRLLPRTIVLQVVGSMFRPLLKKI
ncbi:SDR family NAD(P)-dependent oxidoreductase [Paenibacillus daejeonensis]|uniref:SDR family NAD(P)-dependent oxidoreductase n=1 Tax=Paenibacillus daejeonensis TaxID=135193 RepID=UPI00037B412E|nr:SDR family oxidoreductase [Paenibacillus daejeonensis]